MNVFAALSYRLRRRINRVLTYLAYRFKGSIYLYLAALFTVLIVVDAQFLHFSSGMKQVGLDLMVKYRFLVPKPDKDIVIVDINETSLAAMAREHGRWPWPRKVLGEFVQKLELQKPRAIVFDIIFSEPDVYNKDSDAYFDSVIAATSNTYFPMLRLDPYDDAQSTLNPAMLPGAIPAESGEIVGDATIAMLVPFFDSVRSSGRAGLSNIDPDADGVTRQHRSYIEEYGWKIPSLPYRLAQDLEFPNTDAQHLFLNWRGPAFTYRSESFSDVYQDLMSTQHKRPQDEFRDKIVIIGSTASGLFDIRPTPVSKSHPGVEILATAIDNFKHADYLRIPDTRITYMLLTLAVIWITAWGFYRDTFREKLDPVFGASQAILIAVSYGSINLSNTYINLTGPVTLGLAYFTVARLYSFAVGNLLERSAVRASLQGSGAQHAVLMRVDLSGPPGALNAGVRDKVRHGLMKIGSRNKSVELLKGPQKGIWHLFENTLVISWLTAADDAEAVARIEQDIAAIQAALLPLLRKHYQAQDSDAVWDVHRTTITSSSDAARQWRVLLGRALSGDSNSAAG